MTEHIEILLVEDHDLHARRIMFCLEKLGYESIVRAENVESALQLMDSMQPDLILMDINLPGELDGIDFVNRIQEYRQTNSVPVIYITSRVDKETFDRAKKTAPDAYLTKQVNPVYIRNVQAAVELSLARCANKKTNAEPAAEASSHDWASDLLIGNAFYVKVGNHSRKVNTKAVTYIHRSADRYCDIYTEGQKLCLRSSLSELMKRLPEEQFVQIHRAYAINLAFLEAIHEAKKVLVVAGVELPIGKTFKTEFSRRRQLYS